MESDPWGCMYKALRRLAQQRNASRGWRRSSRELVQNRNERRRRERGGEGTAGRAKKRS